MPIDLAAHNKQCVEDLFGEMVEKLTLRGVETYVVETLEASYLGVDAIQVREGVNKVNSTNLGFLPSELVWVFLNHYIKPVITAPELQYLFPDRPTMT